MKKGDGEVEKPKPEAEPRPEPGFGSSKILKLTSGAVNYVSRAPAPPPANNFFRFQFRLPRKIVGFSFSAPSSVSGSGSLTYRVHFTSNFQLVFFFLGGGGVGLL